MKVMKVSDRRQKQKLVNRRVPKWRGWADLMPSPTPIMRLITTDV